MAMPLMACVFSRAGHMLINDGASSGRALGDAGGPLFHENEAGEECVSGVGVERGHHMTMRPSMGGGTRACGIGRANEPGWAL